MGTTNLKTLSRINPDHKTYRIPVTITGTSFRIETDALGTSIFGDIADRLGRYENCGLTLEEIEEHARQLGKLNKEKEKAS